MVLAERNKLSLYWVPGLSRTTGNEKADFVNLNWPWISSGGTKISGLEPGQAIGQ